MQPAKPCIPLPVVATVYEDFNHLHDLVRQLYYFIASVLTLKLTTGTHTNDNYILITTFSAFCAPPTLTVSADEAFTGMCSYKGFPFQHGLTSKFDRCYQMNESSTGNYGAYRIQTLHRILSMHISLLMATHPA